MTPAFDATQVVDSGGWDLIVGLPLAQLDAALAVQASGLDLAFRYTGGGDGQTYVFDGTFGPWSITGGSGQDLTLSVPIAHGSFSATGTGEGVFALPNGPFDLAGVSVAIETRLQFRTPAGQRRTTSLLFDFDTRSSLTPSRMPAAPGTPSAGRLTGGAALPPLIADLLPGAVASCLAANIAKMDLVFARLTAPVAGSVDADGTAGQWQYAIPDRQGEAGSMLAVFYAATAQSAPPADIPVQIGIAGNQCVAVLSRQATLQSVMIPIIVNAMNHMPAPCPEPPGAGPQPTGQSPGSNDVSPAGFVATAAAGGPDTGRIRAPQPITLDLGASTSGALLVDYACVITGTRATMSYVGGIADKPISIVPSQTVSQTYDIVIGKTDDVFNIQFLSAGPASITPPDPVHPQGALSATFDSSLDLTSLPFAIALFGNRRIDLQQGYLNGGLALAGPVATASP